MNVGMLACYDQAKEVTAKLLNDPMTNGPTLPTKLGSAAIAVSIGKEESMDVKPYFNYTSVVVFLVVVCRVSLLPTKLTRHQQQQQQQLFHYRRHHLLCHVLLHFLFTGLHCGVVLVALRFGQVPANEPKARRERQSPVPWHCRLRWQDSAKGGPHGFLWWFQCLLWPMRTACHDHSAVHRVHHIDIPKDLW